MKNIFLIIPLTIFLMISCTIAKDSNSEESENAQVTVEKSTPVRVLKLAYSDFYLDLAANGKIVSHQLADLKFQTSERILKIYVKNGDNVIKGQKIAELDRFKLQNSLMQAKDNLARARIELQDVLIGQGYSLADSLKVPAEIMNIARVRSSYDQSVNNFKLAEFNYNNSILYAPFSGVVANLFQKEQNLPSSSEPFCTIIDNQHPEVEFKILETEVALVQKGDKVKVSPYSISDYSTTGTISEINPLIDKYGMVYVKALLPPSEKLMDGMNVKILIQRKVSSQLVIPKEALVMRTNKKVVFTLKTGMAYWNYVATGLENSTGFVITEGLQIGDSIIYDGNINLAHESPVTIIK